MSTAHRIRSLTARITKLNTVLAALDMIESAHPTIRLDTSVTVDSALEAAIAVRPALEGLSRALTRELFDEESKSQLPLPFPER